MYNAALESAGYTERVNYDRKNNENKPSRNSKLNIIWHNPPYNKSVSTNIGRVFQNLLDKHFHKEHKFNKIFIRNSVKVSYSCTRNIEHIIKNHNRKITESYIEKAQVIRRESITTEKIMKINHQETESAKSFGTILHTTKVYLLT